MRWNPRRRQVTSVVYVQSNKPAGPEKPKSPWTSLEVAKIIVGAMTPLFIAGFGWYATNQSHQQDVERLAKENLRERRAAAEPLIYDLEHETDSFRDLAQESAYRYSMTLYGVKPGSRTFDDIATLKKPLREAASEFASHTTNDWRQLREIIDNDKLYGELSGLFELGVGMRVVQTEVCFQAIDMNALNPSFDVHEATERCLTPMRAALFRDCRDEVLISLRHFESDISALTLANLKGWCLTSAQTPSAASAPDQNKAP